MFHMIYSANCYLCTHNSKHFHTVHSLHWLVLTVCKLTPWSRVTLEMPRAPQPVTRVPAFYGTQGYIIVFPTAHHLYPQWIQHIQSMPSPPMFWISTLTLHTHLYLGHPNSPSPSGFPTRILCVFLPWYAYYMLCPSHPSGLYPKNKWQEVQIMNLLICTFIHPHVTFFPFRVTNLPLQPTVKIFRRMFFV